MDRPGVDVDQRSDSGQRLERGAALDDSVGAGGGADMEIGRPQRIERLGEALVMLREIKRLPQQRLLRQILCQRWKEGFSRAENTIGAIGCASQRVAQRERIRLLGRGDDRPGRRRGGRR